MAAGVGVALLLAAPPVAGELGLAGLLGVVGCACLLLVAGWAWCHGARPETGRCSRGRGQSLRAMPVAPTASLHWLLGACSDAVLVTDLEGRVVSVNQPLVELWGGMVPDGSRLDGGGFMVGRIAEHEEFAGLMQRLYRHPEQRASGELTYLGRSVRVLGWMSEPIRDHDDNVVGRGFILHDRTQERELAALKSDFLSTVTHELRTPLTSVKGSLQLVLGSAKDLSGINRELLDISLKNTNRLIRLINDILDVSQLEIGKMDLAFTRVTVAPLIEEAVAGLRAYAAGRDISIGCESADDLPPVEGDRDRLIQVLTNLISNAVKFSPVGGRVLVRARHGEEGVAIAVRDWGIGICETDQLRLFRRFQRLNPGGSTEPGTGLGLAISKAIVERHGGRIKVESREAEGSTFTVVLPAAAAGTPAEDGEANGAGGADPERRRTILLVDDDRDFGTVLEVSLGGTYRLLRAESGVQAVDVARAERPDLILLDVALADISGYDVLRILQNSGATRRIPVVMLTVRPDRELARTLGAVDVVSKPVGIDELRLTIDRALRGMTRDTGTRILLGPLDRRRAAVLAEALEARGHCVFTAGDPWELLHRADECDPDVVVVESMPQEGADKTIAFLRGHPSTRRVPVVLVGAVSDEEPIGVECTLIPVETQDEVLVRRIAEAATGRRPGMQPAAARSSHPTPSSLS